MADQVYRMIATYTAKDGKQAKQKADAAVKALGAGADLSRITTRRETWGSVPDEDEGGSQE